MPGKLTALSAFGIAALALALALILHADLAHRAWAARLSLEGSPPPARDANSKTGYVLDQRHLLATHQRGETYRWIETTQDFIASGPWASTTYDTDTLPDGRPLLLPKIYATWLASIAAGLHALTGEPAGIAVEQATLWEPVISHILALIAVAAFMWRRFGPVAGGLSALFFALFPAVSGQFLPGSLSTTPWALLSAAYAIASCVPHRNGPTSSSGPGTSSALAAGLALWLDPAFGFPAVLISAAAGAAIMLTSATRPRFIVWAVTGSVVTVFAWLIDQAPWRPAAGELRYVHPLYALAWLGIGLGLAGWQRLRSSPRRRGLPLIAIVVGIGLIIPLVAVQLGSGYAAWLFTGTALRRLTSVDETHVFNSIFAWLTDASATEAMLLLAPVLTALAAVTFSAFRDRGARAEKACGWVVSALALSGVLILTVFKVRWGGVASLVALPLLADFAWRASPHARRALLAGCGLFLVGLLVWSKHLPPSLERPGNATVLKPADLEALVFRHFAHWMATHHPGRPVSALAPPELSDSLAFHGGCRVLLSTAWESYPGHIAASRILSAPEAGEAEAVIESLGLTHVILTSWDKVLPLLARDKGIEGKDTLYARLQKWVLPRLLRPMPYRLPSVPGNVDQKLAVFNVTAPQDEALLLSRLAEYFVEMDRPEPARLVAKVLAESFADDPNATLARSTVYLHAGDPAALEQTLVRLKADATAGNVPFGWDRRVQRAIVLALAGQLELARSETAACVGSISIDALFDLTPLQAHRLGVLSRNFGVAIPDEPIAHALASLSREYSPGTLPTSPSTQPLAQ